MQTSRGQHAKVENKFRHNEEAHKPLDQIRATFNQECTRDRGVGRRPPLRAKHNPRYQEVVESSTFYRSTASSGVASHGD